MFERGRINLWRVINSITGTTKIILQRKRKTMILVKVYLAEERAELRKSHLVETLKLYLDEICPYNMHEFEDYVRRNAYLGIVYISGTSISNYA